MEPEKHIDFDLVKRELIGVIFILYIIFEKL